MLDQFSRTQLLVGKEAMDRLANSRVAIFGIGGVGGYVVEALARSGVGTLDLMLLRFTLIRISLKAFSCS